MRLKKPKVFSFWLDQRHIDFLELFKDFHNLSSRGAALRAIIDIVSKLFQKGETQ